MEFYNRYVNQGKIREIYFDLWLMIVNIHVRQFKVAKSILFYS